MVARPREARLSRLGAALLSLGVLVAPANAADWLYTVRPGDHLWNLAERYLRDRNRWLELGRYNGLADPDRLEPGTTLKIPIAWLRVRPAPAVLVAARGPVHILAADGRARPAEAGLRLEGGERLVTGPEATAVVRFADGSELEVHPDCEVLFDRLAAYGRTGMVDTRLRLERGRLRARVPSGTGGFGIDTPAATAAVRGTAFRIASEPEATRVEGLESRVVVEAAGAVRTLAAGTGTIARAGAPPIPPRPLLPPPRVVGPLVAESVPQRLRLEPVAGAVGYRLEILEAAAEGALLLARTTSGPELVFDLPDGTYRLRARAIDPDGIEGRDLDAPLAIRARPEPPVPLRPRQGGIEREERPRFAWAAPEGAEGYRVQLARDPGFGAPIGELEVHEPGATFPFPLADGAWWWRVATRAQGREGPFGPPVAFTRQPSGAPVAAEPASREDGLLLCWPQPEPGQKRRVQLARDPGFFDPVLDRTIEGAELLLPWPDPGRWYLRSRTIEADGFEGPWSPAQAIDVPWRSFWPILLPLLLGVLALL